MGVVGPGGRCFRSSCSRVAFPDLSLRRTCLRPWNGLLAAGVSASSHFARLLPKWVVRLGLVIAATGALSALGLLSLPMTVAIPVTRVGGFVWLIAVGALMPRCSARLPTDDR